MRFCRVWRRVNTRLRSRGSSKPGTSCAHWRRDSCAATPSGRRSERRAAPDDTSRRSNMSYKVFAIESADHIGTLWLNNPERRNAMGPDFWNELPVAMQALDADEQVRAVVIAARGPHFTVGLDLKSMMGSLGGSGDGGPKTRMLDEIMRLQRSIS